MTGRIASGLFPGVAIFLAVGGALGQGIRPLRTNKRLSGIARPMMSYGSTHQARIITLRAILGTVARSAVVTFAKLRPTKTACARGQVQNERFCKWFSWIWARCVSLQGMKHSPLA